MQITGGEFKGRPLKVPPGQNTRPTLAKLRQAMFNSIQAYIPDARVLDLFAGSGSLGIEALSRGAESVVAVENHSGAARAIEQNVQIFKIQDRYQLIRENVAKVWPRVLEKGPFDLVFADPPYEDGWEGRLLTEAPWEILLKPDGLFLLEWGALKSGKKELPESVPFLVKIREKNYGDTVLTTYRCVVKQASEEAV